MNELGLGQPEGSRSGYCHELTCCGGQLRELVYPSAKMRAAVKNNRLLAHHLFSVLESKMQLSQILTERSYFVLGQKTMAA